MKSMKKSKKAASRTSSKASKKKTAAGKTKTSMKAKSSVSEAKPFPPSPRPDLHAEPKSKKTKPSITRVYEPAPHESSHMSRAAQVARNNARLPIRQPAREIHLHSRAPDSQTKQQSPSKRASAS